MTDQEVKAFYRDLGALCKKHKMSGLAGVWFAGEHSDLFGELKFWDIADSRMKLVIEDITDKYQRWARHTVGHLPRPVGNIHELTDDEPQDN